MFRMIGFPEKSVAGKTRRKMAKLLAAGMLPLALTACVTSRPEVTPPPSQALAVREVVESMKADARVNQPALPRSAVPSTRLVALASLRASAFAPGEAVADLGASPAWFQEPALNEVEECAHCKVTGTVRISSEYGKRRDPRRRQVYRHHHGVDIRAPKGSPALAFKGGTVIRANRFSSYGLTVEIRQYDGLVARYAHLNRILVGQGDEVDAGTQVGEVGRTGRTTGSHLHFELIRDGESMDPMLFLSRPEQIVRCMELETAGK